MAEWRSAQCDCGCRPARCKPGCPCPDCQPGPGRIYRRRGLREVLREAGIDAAEQHYCVRCNDIVLVISVERDDHWTHICKPRAHGWRTEGPI
jgi:hypothetical protein